ncbi:DUF2778 domain-containing protein [Kluyvera chengduensis]|uniref:DUF2778 domain-containing protein n=1 Tax=Kluyvera sp. 142359 TaxID=3375726 RepID=UPI0037748432
MSTLVCPGVGLFSAYSGTGRSRNQPSAVNVPEVGPLPPGQYFIVTRGTGGMLTGIRDTFASIVAGSDRSIWFALYRNDSQIDDLTFIDKVERGHFRLHPAGYRGISEGCITLPFLSDFNILREALLNSPTMQVTSSLVAFGTIQVY